MITFESLAARPSAFASLSGLTPADFGALYQDFATFYARDRQASLTRTGEKRQRAAGGGTPFSQGGRTRLLMALVWLRVYPTLEVLGFFFGLDAMRVATAARSRSTPARRRRTRSRPKWPSRPTASFSR